MFNITWQNGDFTAGSYYQLCYFYDMTRYGISVYFDDK